MTCLNSDRIEPSSPASGRRRKDTPNEVEIATPANGLGLAARRAPAPQAPVEPRSIDHAKGLAEARPARRGNPALEPAELSQRR